MKIKMLILVLTLTIGSCTSDCVSKTGIIEGGNYDSIVLLNTGSYTTLHVSGYRVTGCCDELLIFLSSQDSEFKFEDLKGNPNVKINVPPNEEIEVTFSALGYPCSCSDPLSFKYELTLE